MQEVLGVGGVRGVERNLRGAEECRKATVLVKGPVEQVAGHCWGRLEEGGREGVAGGGCAWHVGKN